MNLNDLAFNLRVYVYFLTVVTGLCMGSFLNCCAYRMCHGISVTKGRSRCDRCGHQLGFKDLIPVLSYAFSGGRCRYCGERLPAMYPVSEIVSGLVFFLVVYRYGLSVFAAKYLVLAMIMLCASFADLEDFVIPDVLIVLGLVNRLVFALASGNFLYELKSSIIGALAISVPLYFIVIITEKILNKEAMGGGDIKLVFMLGSYLSFGEGLLGLLLSCVCGIGFAYASQKTEEPFPFGPGLCIGYFISILYGSNIIDSYLGLF